MKVHVALAAAFALPLVATSAIGQTTPPAPPPSSQPAFPPPKLVQVTDALKCDWGPIKEKVSGGIVVTTPAGLFTVLTGDARVVGPNTNATISASALEPGQSVRVYYLVKDGARALEIDVIPPPAAAK